MKCTTEICFDGRNYYFVIPEEIAKSANLRVNDNLMIDNIDGGFSMQKIEKETEVVLVESIQQYRMRYLVNVPKGKAEYALDAVVCSEASEFSQENLGETISSHRVVNEVEILELYKTDWPNWHNDSDEEKLNEIYGTNKFF